MKSTHTVVIILLFTGFLAGLTFFIQSCDSKHQGPDFEHLTCEALENPVGIDHSHPLFSWVMTQQGYNQSQSPLQIKGDNGSSVAYKKLKSGPGILLGSGTYIITIKTKANTHSN